MKRTRSYSELIKFETLEERYEYLKLNGTVGKQTFGWDRYFNQCFYHSPQWRAIRDKVIVRDYGCDLGIEGFEVRSNILIHHMNPIWIEDLKQGNPDILDPEYLITTCDRTHQAIHYGDISLLRTQIPIVRQHGDTKLW